MQKLRSYVLVVRSDGAAFSQIKIEYETLYNYNIDHMHDVLIAVTKDLWHKIMLNRLRSGCFRLLYRAALRVNSGCNEQWFDLQLQKSTPKSMRL